MFLTLNLLSSKPQFNRLCTIINLTSDRKNLEAFSRTKKEEFDLHGLLHFSWNEHIVHSRIHGVGPLYNRLLFRFGVLADYDQLVIES